MATGTGCSSSTAWNWLTGNGIVCNETFQQSEQNSEASGIKAVVSNAQMYYGPESVAAQAAATAGQAQLKNVSTDITSLNNEIADSSVGKIFGADCDGEPGVDLSIIGLGCWKNSRLKVIGIAAAVVLVAGVVLYAMGIANSFLPRRG